MRKLFVILTLLVTTPHSWAEQITVTDTKDRSLTVEIISYTEKGFKARRVKDGKEFELQFDQLSVDSATKAKALKETVEAKNKKAASLPELEVDISISKRRRHQSNSSYMKNMTISAKIDYKLKRLDIEAATCKAHIIYFGEDQAKGNFSILKKEAFDMSPTKAVATHNAEPFITTYDSDNKGQGNIGGYKYDGYLLVVLSEDGELILNKTSISKLEKQLEEIPALSKKILAMKGTSGLQGIDL